jgi:hypothetical protein
VAKEEHWEFYCTPDEVCAELGNWHWRLHRGGTVIEASLRFDSFTYCD